MKSKSPLQLTGITTEGKLVINGIFTMQDQVGFPLDASFEECKRYGVQIDWLEALCSCWLNDCLKFDSFVKQASLLTGVDMLAKFKTAGAIYMCEHTEIKYATNPVDEFCKAMLS